MLQVNLGNHYQRRSTKTSSETNPLLRKSPLEIPANLPKNRVIKLSVRPIESTRQRSPNVITRFRDPRGGNFSRFVFLSLLTEQSGHTYLALRESVSWTKHFLPTESAKIKDGFAIKGGNVCRGVHGISLKSCINDTRHSRWTRKCATA